MTTKIYKSHDELMANGFSIKVGINKVLIFKGAGIHFEVWEDKKEFHIGIAYKDNKGEEFRYRHFLLNQVPKKWNKTINEMIETYNKVCSQIEFTNYK